MWEYHFLYEFDHLCYFGRVGEGREGGGVSESGDVARRINNTSAKETLLF